MQFIKESKTGSSDAPEGFFSAGGGAKGKVMFWLTALMFFFFLQALLTGQNKK